MSATERLHRATAVAREYDAMMGLSSVSVGLGCLLGAATGQTRLYLALGALLAGMSASWYVKRHGQVRGTSARRALLLAGASAAVLVLLLGVILDRRLAGPVLITLLAVAGSLAVGQRLMLRRVGLTPVHWIVYAAVALSAFGPLIGVDRGAAALPYVLVVSGAALIVLGLVDHVRLVRILGPVPAADDPEPGA